MQYQRDMEIWYQYLLGKVSTDILTDFERVVAAVSISIR